MNNRWRQFLESIGATVMDNLEVEFSAGRPGSGDRDQGGFLMALPGLSVIEVEGTDAAGFLHGQFTTDLLQLSDDIFQYSAWCNPKGRTIAVFIIYRLANCFYILIPTVLKDRFLKRLRIYILRSQVTIHDRSEELVCSGIIVHGHTTGLPAIPEKSGLLLHGQDHVVLRIADNKPLRLLTVGSVSTTVDLWQSLESNYTCSGSGYWNYHDIVAGIPWLSEETSELFLPQELSLDVLNGLNYTKGCFPGQEVIARVHYRGNVKQRLLLSKAPAGGRLPGTGDRLYSRDSDSAVGTIINVANNGWDEVGILAVADNDLAGNDLHLAEGITEPIRFHAH